MALKIVRNDITKMECDAIVNTANEDPIVGAGCDTAIYTAAGYDELLKYRTEEIGHVNQGDVFVTPAFKLPYKCIIHAVSPVFSGGENGEEKLLRSCYSKSLNLALDNDVKSIAFPLISTGSFGYPKEEGLSIAIDEINKFLLKHDMLVYIVVFSREATRLGERLYPELEKYINENYVEEMSEYEYDDLYIHEDSSRDDILRECMILESEESKPSNPRPGNLRRGNLMNSPNAPALYGFRRYDIAKEAPILPGSELKSEPKVGSKSELKSEPESTLKSKPKSKQPSSKNVTDNILLDSAIEIDSEQLSSLEERMRHLTDTFSEYLLYLIEEKGYKNSDVYTRAWVDKKVFSKIKTNPDYHPQKNTVMCLCIGAMLNLDESKDLLARAGYALSPCSKTDFIFSFYIDNKLYDM